MKVALVSALIQLLTISVSIGGSRGQQFEARHGSSELSEEQPISGHHQSFNHPADHVRKTTRDFDAVSGAFQESHELPRDEAATGGGGGRHHDCNNNAISKCVGHLEVLTNKDLGFAASVDELNKMCPVLLSGLQCIDHYTRRCLTPKHREYFNKLYAGTIRVIKDLCNTKGKYQLEYIRHAPCMRQVNPEYNRCSEVYHEKTANLNQVTEAVVQISDEEKSNNVITLCCSFQEYLQCSERVVYETCGNDTASFTKEFLDRMAGPIVQDLCQAFSFTLQSCPQEFSASSPHTTVRILDPNKANITQQMTPPEQDKHPRNVDELDTNRLLLNLRPNITSEDQLNSSSPFSSPRSSTYPTTTPLTPVAVTFTHATTIRPLTPFPTRQQELVQEKEESHKYSVEKGSTRELSDREAKENENKETLSGGNKNSSVFSRVLNSTYINRATETLPHDSRASILHDEEEKSSMQLGFKESLPSFPQHQEGNSEHDFILREKDVNINAKENLLMENPTSSKHSNCTANGQVDNPLTTADSLNCFPTQTASNSYFSAFSAPDLSQNASLFSDITGHPILSGTRLRHPKNSPDPMIFFSFMGHTLRKLTSNSTGGNQHGQFANEESQSILSRPENLIQQPRFSTRRSLHPNSKQHHPRLQQRPHYRTRGPMRRRRRPQSRFQQLRTGRNHLTPNIKGRNIKKRPVSGVQRPNFRPLFNSTERSDFMDLGSVEEVVTAEHGENMLGTEDSLAEAQYKRTNENIRSDSRNGGKVLNHRSERLRRPGIRNTRPRRPYNRGTVVRHGNRTLTTNRSRVDRPVGSDRGNKRRNSFRRSRPRGGGSPNGPRRRIHSRWQRPVRPSMRAPLMQNRTRIRHPGRKMRGHPAPGLKNESVSRMTMRPPGVVGRTQPTVTEVFPGIYSSDHKPIHERNQHGTNEYETNIHRPPLRYDKNSDNNDNDKSERQQHYDTTQGEFTIKPPSLHYHHDVKENNPFPKNITNNNSRPQTEEITPVIAVTTQETDTSPDDLGLIQNELSHNIVTLETKDIENVTGYSDFINTISSRPEDHSSLNGNPSTESADPYSTKNKDADISVSSTDKVIGILNQTQEYGENEHSFSVYDYDHSSVPSVIHEYDDMHNSVYDHTQDKTHSLEHLPEDNESDYSDGKDGFATLDDLNYEVRSNQDSNLHVSQDYEELKEHSVENPYDETFSEGEYDATTSVTEVEDQDGKISRNHDQSGGIDTTDYNGGDDAYYENYDTGNTGTIGAGANAIHDESSSSIKSVEDYVEYANSTHYFDDSTSFSQDDNQGIESANASSDEVFHWWFRHRAVDAVEEAVIPAPTPVPYAVRLHREYQSKMKPSRNFIPITLDILETDFIPMMKIETENFKENYTIDEIMNLADSDLDSSTRYFSFSDYWETEETPEVSVYDDEKNPTAINVTKMGKPEKSNNNTIESEVTPEIVDPESESISEESYSENASDSKYEGKAFKEKASFSDRNASNPTSVHNTNTSVHSPAVSTDKSVDHSLDHKYRYSSSVNNTNTTKEEITKEGNTHQTGDGIGTLLKSNLSEQMVPDQLEQLVVESSSGTMTLTFESLVLLVICALSVR